MSERVRIDGGRPSSSGSYPLVFDRDGPTWIAVHRNEHVFGSNFIGGEACANSVRDLREYDV